MSEPTSDTLFNFCGPRHGGGPAVNVAVAEAVAAGAGPLHAVAAAKMENFPSDVAGHFLMRFE